MAGEVVDIVASLAGGFAPLRVDVACGPIKNFSYVVSPLKNALILTICAVDL